MPKEKTTPEAEAPIAEEKPVEKAPAPKKKQPDPMMYACKTRGLKIVIEPKRDIYNEKLRTRERVPGRYIRFVEGRVTLTDPADIEYMENYRKNKPDIICLNVVTKKDEAKAKKALEEIQSKIRKGKQGASSGG